MMANIVMFTGSTTHDLNPDALLEANKGIFETLCFFGRNKDGKFIAGSSISSVGEMLILIELFKLTLMEGIE